MKPIKLFLAALMCMMVSTAAFADDIPIPVEQLPAVSKNYVYNHFKGRSIVYAERDWDSYECRLDDGTKIEFWRDGSLKKIETYSTGNMPGDCMSESIGAYVNGHFPGCVVTKIERKYYGYEVELSNDIELKFNHRGVLIDVDD